VHFDLHPHNLLADGEHLLAIIDLDSLRVFERMRAVAFALHRIVRQHIVFTQPEDIRAAAAEATRVFLDAYRTHMPLTNKDIHAIPYFIRTEALARLSYAMKDNYLHKNQTWKQDLEKQVSHILEAGYFTS
jgi:Ser/Thr protein kinase RdoA (MazF antagonist)